MFRRNADSPQFALPPHLWRIRPIQLMVVDLGDWLIPFVGINLLWVASCLTVILLPPATAALFAAAHLSFQNHPPTAGQFLASMRRWFVTSWLITFANVLIIGGLFLLGRLVHASEILLAAIAVLTAGIIWIQFLFWPFMLLQAKPSPIQAIRNSAFTIMGDLPYFAGYLALIILVLLTSAILIAPVFFVTPVLFALINTYSLCVWLQHRGILNTEKRDV